MGVIQTEMNACCGCSACEAVCPTGALKMKEKELGFPYPSVRKDLCINCGKCLKVCQIGKVFSHKIAVQKYYAAQHKDRKIRMLSSSGGVFHAFAKWVIDNGGIVYGVSFDENWNVKHIGAVNMKQAAGMYGSKYVQSENRNVYQNIAEHLKKGRTVLFTGTPCQCQAVSRYAKACRVDNKNLYLVDFVCHGVGSPGIWKRYIERVKRNHGEIRNFTFRDKENGWRNYKTKAVDKKGRHIIGDSCAFFEMYSSLLIVRSSCFQCSYTSYKRCTDVTLGDFWNIGNPENNFEIESGVSQVLVNTKKGAKLLEQVSKELLLLPCSAKDCWQPHLEYPAKCPSGRETFIKYYEKHMFEEVLKKYGNGTWTSGCRKEAVKIARKCGAYVWAGKVYKRICRLGKKRV